MLGMLAITLAIFLTPTIIYVSGNEKRLGRLTYLFRMMFLSSLLLAFFIMNIAQAASFEEISIFLKDPTNDFWKALSWQVILVVTIIISVHANWTVRRLNDVGWSKWLALLALIPFVNGIFQMLLVTVPGRRLSRDYSESFD